MIEAILTALEMGALFGIGVVAGALSAILAAVAVVVAIGVPVLIVGWLLYATAFILTYIEEN